MDPARDQRPHIILIVGLSHSGSTILERALACHSEAVGLGEVYHTLRAFTRQGWGRLQRPCSCGTQGQDCPVWSRLSDQPRQAPFQDRLVDLLTHAAATNNAKVLIDSSKRRDQAYLYARLQNQGRVHVYPVILVRDYRAWATTSAHKRRGLTRNWDYLALTWKWLHRHLLMRAKLRWYGLSAPLILFDHFTHNPDRVVQQIYAQLPASANLDSAPEQLDLAHSQQHALTGNAIRTDPTRNRTIISDDAWRQDPRVTRLRWLTWGPELLRRWFWRHQDQC